MAAVRTRGRGAEPTAKPRFDAYAGMLVLSLLAMVAGSVLLFMDYSQYEGKPSLPPAVRPAAGAPQGGAPGVPPGPGPGAPGPGVPGPGGPGGPAKPPG